ncbi:hypothetical protein SGPA1_20914 [Streptomyces misionensis JCM 4497]
MGGSEHSAGHRRTYEERAHVVESGRRDRRLSAAPGQGGADRAGRLPVRGGLRAVPEERERGRRELGRRRVARRGIRRRRPARHPRRHPVGVRLPAGPRGRQNGSSVCALRRPAAAGRDGLGHSAVRADRARRPLVRPGGRGLQGRCDHAPARAARAQGERRRPGERQGDRGGLGGAGHGRPGALRRAAPGPADGRHHRDR